MLVTGPSIFQQPHTSFWDRVKSRFLDYNFSDFGDYPSHPRRAARAQRGGAPRAAADGGRPLPTRSPSPRAGCPRPVLDHRGDLVAVVTRLRRDRPGQAPGRQRRAGTGQGAQDPLPRGLPAPRSFRVEETAPRRARRPRVHVAVHPHHVRGASRDRVPDDRHRPRHRRPFARRRRTTSTSGCKEQSWPLGPRARRLSPRPSASWSGRAPKATSPGWSGRSPRPAAVETLTQE